jgi:hypothetical protein
MQLHYRASPTKPLLAPGTSSILTYFPAILAASSQLDTRQAGSAMGKRWPGRCRGCRLFGTGSKRKRGLSEMLCLLLRKKERLDDG